jgi:hypothetical protein
MKKLFESWRQYKLLVEEADSELRKQVYPTKISVPIQRWADEWGFTLRELDSNRLKAYLGSGAYGKAFVAIKDGKEYAVKIGDARRQDEMRVIQKLIDIRDSLPEDIKKHIIKFYSPEELGFKDKVKDDKDILYHVSVAELLQPLKPGDFKKFTSQKIYDKTDNIEVNKNPFWSNSEWGEVENALLGNLGEGEIPERLFVDALYEVRKLITKRDKLSLLMYAKEPSARGEKGSSTSGPKFFWSEIWTEMIMDRLFKGEKGKRLANHFIKNMGMEPQAALANIWQMVDKAGNLIFFANLPVDYSYGDEDTDPNVLPAGELKSFHKAMKFLRDKYDIAPSDIHSGNVMRRGDDWVVMDVGLFEIGN